MLNRKTAMRSKTQLKAKATLKARAPMKAAKCKTSEIRKSAKGEQCLVRIPGVCNRDTSTTILAHLNGAGVCCKHGDHKAAYCCSACHDWLDGAYVRYGYGRTTRDLWHLESVIRTQDRLIEKGLLLVKDAA